MYEHGSASNTAVAVADRPEVEARHQRMYDWAMSHIKNVNGHQKLESFKIQWEGGHFERCYAIIVEYVKENDDYEIGAENAKWINSIREGALRP